MLLKMFGCILVILGCGGIGFSLGNDYILRIKHLEQVKRYFVLLAGEIQYGNSGIFEALNKLSKQSSGFFSDFLAHVAENMNNNKSLKAAWEISIKEILKESSRLGGNDILIISELGESLGLTDKETQLKNIDNALVQLNEAVDELKKNKNEKCKIYKTSGVVVGAFITILLL